MFKFEIGSFVDIIASDERGEIIGRAQYQFGQNQYLVRYQAGDNRAVEVWWAESALSK